MNINYDEIITKANERKEALKAFAGALQEMEQQGEALFAALNYFSNLGKLLDKVDVEGRNMLGEVHIAAYYAASCTNTFKDQMFGPAIKERRITWLRQCLEAA